jgi:[protein-PII] uridylyltransferase
LYELAESIQKSAPLPEPNIGRLSRQSKSFPIQARVSLQPDERNEYFALTLSASDRSGLLYAVAKALAKHRVSLHTARINTLGERVEDIMLLDGTNLSKNPKLQIQLETELLEVLAA